LIVEYHGNELSIREVADKLGCSQGTINHWMDKFCIDRRQVRGQTGEEWKNPDVLKELYHDKGLSLEQIAMEYDVPRSNILYWMDKHGIDRRNRMDAITSPEPSVFTSRRGYEYAADGENMVQVHKLVAIATGESPNDVFSTNNHIHHQNNIPWDNRANNIELLTASEHMALTQAVERGEAKYDEQ